MALGCDVRGAAAGDDVLVSSRLAGERRQHLFGNMVVAYRRLSRGFRERLHGLREVHSRVEKVNDSILNGGGLGGLRDGSRCGTFIRL